MNFISLHTILYSCMHGHMLYIYHNKTGFMSTWFRATTGNSANKSMSSLGGEPVHEFEEFDLPSVESGEPRTALGNGPAGLYSQQSGGNFTQNEALTNNLWHSL